MLKSPEWISNSYNFILLLKGKHASNKTQSLSMLCCSDVIRYISKATDSFFKLKEVTEVLNLKLICFHINIIQVHHSFMVMTYYMKHIVKKGYIRRVLDLQYISTGTCTCKYTVQILIVAQQLYFLYLQNIWTKGHYFWGQYSIIISLNLNLLKT